MVVASLPHTADPSSVRVAARGHDLALLNVEVQRRVAAEPRRESLAQLRADVERCRDAVKELDDADEAERAGLGFLGHLSEAAATSLARALGAGGPATTSCRGWPATCPRPPPPRSPGGARSPRASASRSASSTPRWNASPAPSSPASRSCSPRSRCSSRRRAATEAEIELTYHVRLASWRPLYDLVLDGEKLKVSYLAEITQRTGEDWPEVTLVLSTTRQGQRQTLPELSPWYIGRPQPPRA